MSWGCSLDFPEPLPHLNTRGLAEKTYYSYSRVQLLSLVKIVIPEEGEIPKDPSEISSLSLVDSGKVGKISAA